MSNVRIVDASGTTHQGSFDKPRGFVEGLQQFCYHWALAKTILLVVLLVALGYMIYKSRDSFSNPAEGWFTSGASLRHMVGRSEAAYDGRDYLTGAREPIVVSSYNEDLAALQNGSAAVARLQAEMAGDAAVAASATTENYMNPSDSRYSEKALQSKLRGSL